MGYHQCIIWPIALVYHTGSMCFSAANNLCNDNIKWVFVWKEVEKNVLFSENRQNIPLIELLVTCSSPRLRALSREKYFVYTFTYSISSYAGKTFASASWTLLQAFRASNHFAGTQISPVPYCWCNFTTNTKTVWINFWAKLLHHLFYIGLLSIDLK